MEIESPGWVWPESGEAISKSGWKPFKRDGVSSLVCQMKTRGVLWV